MTNKEAATQLEVASHWLSEAAVALVKEDYLRDNLRRVARECNRAARRLTDDKT
tara:strand:- start:147711 stop:147872 length:162 start_codon:yes stop_codon:yes gene_type:complete